MEASTVPVKPGVGPQVSARGVLEQACPVTEVGWCRELVRGSGESSVIRRQ